VRRRYDPRTSAADSWRPRDVTALGHHLGGPVTSSRARRPADAAPLVDALGDRLGPAVTFVTTEHFNLQTARAATIAEANGRANIYLAALSGDLIALALIGQTSRLGTAFYAFALITLPVIALVGLVTFQRLVQSSIEDLAYAQRIGRLREFYLSVAPQLASYLVVARAAPSAAAMLGARPGPSNWQLMLTTAGMVAAVNSIVIGACAGLLLASLAVDSLAFTLVTGAVVGAAALVMHRVHHRSAVDAYEIDEIDRAAIAAPGARP